MFIDEVKIKVISWKWWDGLVSWRREKYIPKGGPRWWNAWNWGSVFIQTDENLNTLSEYRHKKVLKAEDWQWWGTQLMHWANASDLILKVPVWTIIKDLNTWDLLADLNENNIKLLVAKWWIWWFWNAHFCSSTRQAPTFAELWDIWEEKDLHLELKLVADIWIIWIPSSWKSTFIWNITNVKPKIWDYPFTTLIPNLWVLDYKWKSLVLEDVPWLIKWAHEGKWLWIQFLKHIERTKVLLHMLDLYRMDKVFDDYNDIRQELNLYNSNITKKEEIIVFSKSDLLDNEIKNHIVEEFLKLNKNIDQKKVFVISSVTWEWIDKLIDYLIDNYTTIIINKKNYEEKELKIYDLKTKINTKTVKVEYIWDFTFKAYWERLEQIVRMTDFNNKEAVLRVYDVLDKLWVIKLIEPKIKKILEESWKDNSFFFETNQDESINPKVIISWKEIFLDKLKYNL